MIKYHHKTDFSMSVEWFVLNQGWTPEVLDFIKENKIDKLQLNEAFGWHGDNLDFLREMEWLAWFFIIDHQIKNISGINALRNLEFLHVSTFCMTRIDFSNFNKLKACSFEEWRPGADALFECKNLKYLWLHKYYGSTFKNIANLSNLEALYLNSSRIETVEGIGSLKKLKELRIINRKLKTLEHICGAGNIEHLILQECAKITDIDVLGNLTKLKFLMLDVGEIPSLTPISACKKLEHLALTRPTNVLDGDMAFLKDMPRLKNVYIGNRKHYSHTEKDFPASKRIIHKPRKYPL